MITKENLEYLFFGLLALFVFTLALNTFDNSKFQLNEYNNICHSLYSEKVWIDTCYLPVKQNSSTYDLAMRVEGIGIVASGLLFLTPAASKRG